MVLADATGLVPWAAPTVDVLLLGVGLLDRVAPPAAPAPVVASPVRGPGWALNSPATRTPSHGTHGLGQTHAIDLVLDPPDGSRPEFGSGGQWRRPEEYPAC